MFTETRTPFCIMIRVQSELEKQGYKILCAHMYSSGFKNSIFNISYDIANPYGSGIYTIRFDFLNKTRHPADLHQIYIWSSSADVEPIYTNEKIDDIYEFYTIDITEYNTKIKNVIMEKIATMLPAITATAGKEGY